MNGFKAPEMYTPQEAAGKDVSDVVKQAEVCGSYDAELFVRTQGLTGNKAAGVNDALAGYLSYCNIVTAFDGDEQGFNEAVRLMRELKTEGVRIPVRRESNEFRVDCHRGDYHGPVEPASLSGKVAAHI